MLQSHDPVEILDGRDVRASLHARFDILDEFHAARVNSRMMVCRLHYQLFSSSERAGSLSDAPETFIPRSKAAVFPYGCGGDLTPLRYVVDRLVLEKGLP
jgi:hypothetical protein